VDDWLLEVITKAGYLGIAGLMMLENLIPAIPSELILPFAGFLAADEKLDLVGVIASGSAAGCCSISKTLSVRKHGSNGIRPGRRSSEGWCRASAR
jgi:hypothetical protein